MAPQLKALLAPYPSEKMIAWPVSLRVGNVKNNDPSLIEPITGSGWARWIRWPKLRLPNECQISVAGVHQPARDRSLSLPQGSPQTPDAAPPVRNQ